MGGILFGRGRSFALLLLFLTASNLSVARHIAPSTETKATCASKLARNRRAIVAFTVGMGIILGPGIYHDIEAWRENKTHVGYAIYVDTHHIRETLTPEQRAVWDNTQQRPLETIQLLVQLLNGDHEKELPVAFPRAFFPSARDASEYFSGQSDRRGVCRHKSAILAQILKELGIRAYCELVRCRDGGYHVYVVVPDLDLIADPAMGQVANAQQYRSTNGFTVIWRGLPRFAISY